MESKESIRTTTGLTEKSGSSSRRRKPGGNVGGGEGNREVGLEVKGAGGESKRRREAERDGKPPDQGE
jgi:hypothetical protein